MTKNDRANFGSKLGVILASAGSAVGLGNIWRFPYETGNHGGAAFILIYLACVLILGIPIMVSEFLIGRHSRANTAGAYQKLAPGTHWRWVGRMGVLAGRKCSYCMLHRDNFHHGSNSSLSLRPYSCQLQTSSLCRPYPTYG